MAATTAKRAQRNERQARKEAARRKQRRRDRLQMAAGGTVLLIAVFGIAMALTGTGADIEERIETGEVTVSGDRLATIPQDVTQDPAVGTAAPDVAGTSFDGDPVVLHEDGRATIAVFLAHWCSVCNREVPVIVDHLDPETLPAGVDLVGIPTATDRNQPNYPPSQWLEARDWEFPVLVDSAATEVGSAFGVGAFPAFVVIGADGSVLQRATGALEPEALDYLVDLAASSL